MLSPEFLITTFIIVLIPGTGVIYTISTGLFQGWRKSLIAALGCTAGIIPHLLASMLGLSLILHMSATLFQIIKFVGAAYLLYLAWGMWQDKGEFSFKASTPNNPWSIAGKAILLNLLNPKLTLFFFTFLPLFVSSDGTLPIAEMLILSLVFMLITLVVFISYGILASTVRHYIINSPSAILWLRRSFAITFAGLGLKLALTEH